jgi:hypothetical protein
VWLLDSGCVWQCVAVCGSVWLCGCGWQCGWEHQPIAEGLEIVYSYDVGFQVGHVSVAVATWQWLDIDSVWLAVQLGVCKSLAV